jgi:hypothetical protein
VTPQPSSFADLKIKNPPKSQRGTQQLERNFEKMMMMMMRRVHARRVFTLDGNGVVV